MYNNTTTRRRLCLSIVASYLLLTTSNTTGASTTSTSPSSVIPTSTSSTHPSSSSIAANAQRKKKRRRRKNRESLPSPSAASSENAVGDDDVDDAVAVEDDDGLRNGKDNESHLPRNGTPTCHSTKITADDVIICEGGLPPNMQRKKKKKRRRNVRKGEVTVSGVIRNIDEDDDVLRSTRDLHSMEEFNKMETQREDASLGDDDHVQSTHSTDGESKRRKKKRRRKVEAESIVSTQIDQGVLLPMDDDDDDDDDDDEDSLDEYNSMEIQQDGTLLEDESCTHSTQLQREESFGSSSKEVPTANAEATTEGAPEKIDSSSESPFDDRRDETPRSSITVSRNETTESLTIRDDTDADAPATYEYTQRDEEELAEGVIVVDVARDASMPSSSSSSAATPSDEGKQQRGSRRRTLPPAATMAFVRSTRRRETVEASGGSLGGSERAVSVKVSRRREVRRLHITAIDADDDADANARTKKKTSPSSNRPRKSAAAATATTTTTTRSTGKGGECLRRIKREWKDAARMGIAYDWTNGRTIQPRGTASSSIRDSAAALDDNNNNNDSSNNNVNNNDHVNYVRIGPYNKNLLRWHFSVSGPSDSPYENGVYHGQILLPRDYPGSPPRVQMLTPSGRFQCGVDICLSASNYHPETWTPRWTVIALVDALRMHMRTTANEIGGVVASEERRREFAEMSRGWRCDVHGGGGGVVVDHGRMVEAGMFPSCCREEEVAEEDGGGGTMEDGIVVVDNETSFDSDSDETCAGEDESDPPRHSLPNRSQSHVLEARDELQSPAKKAAKAAKKTHEKTRRSRRRKSATTAKGGKTAKATKARRSEPKAIATADAPDDALERSDVVPSLFKQIVIEMLKLPLRILSVLLHMLIGLESRLRSILDSL